MISIVLPVYNASNFIEQTIASIFEATKNDFELIIIDDYSEKETKDFLDGLSSPQIPIQVIHNPEHKWTNYGWNLGSTLAKQEYVAILNSDIILGKNWDVGLIEELQHCTIACPYEVKSDGKKEFRQALHPVVAEIDPKMINGACFMYKQKDKAMLFPLPEQIKHWCGDNVLADRANHLQGVAFSEKSSFKHFISKSSNTFKDRQEYKSRVLQDIEAYEKHSDRSMRPLKERLFGYK